MSGIEVALIPGMLALGEAIAGQLGHAAAEMQCQSDPKGRRHAGTSHPGIYSNTNHEVQPRSHCGIYCNPHAAVKRAEDSGPRIMPPVAKSRSSDRLSKAIDSLCNSELNDSTCRSTSSHFGSDRLADSESSCESPCPTARLLLPLEATQACQPSDAPRLLSRPKGPECSPLTARLLEPTHEKLCPPTSMRPFGMNVETRNGEKSTSEEWELNVTTYVKKTAKWNYLHQFSGSNSTSSTCSDLDMSRASTISFNVSTCSDLDISRSGEHSPKSVCNDVPSILPSSPSRTEVQKRMPAGASLVDAPPTKARQFCQEAFADLDNLDEEMAELSKDLEALRASVASARYLHATS